jgi:Ring finger domain
MQIIKYVLQMSVCTICLKNIDNTFGTIKLPCNHRFHQLCAVDWICNHDKNSCPVCGAYVSDDDLVEDEESNLLHNFLLMCVVALFLYEDSG